MSLRRTRLRSLLDSLAQQLPGDVRLTGQRVRFALDAGAFRDAWSAATSAVPTAATLPG